jgi:hypothetical protein
MNAKCWSRRRSVRSDRFRDSGWKRFLSDWK